MKRKDRVVCVIDDDLSAREAITELVRSAGLEVEAFASAHDYLAISRATPPGCLVLDMQMPGLSGLQLQKQLLESCSAIPIVFVSGHSDVPMSVRALKAGALDFLTKPFDPDALLMAILAGIGEAGCPGVEPIGASECEQTRCRSVEPDSGSAPSFGPGAAVGIMGTSTVLDAVLAQVRTVARTEATVLIHGETGTGKELIARAIHEQSERKHGPFVKVNCGAIPTGLLESELMGHEKGAFTGAIAQRIGRFELAHGGTLFLDEIGEVAPELQPKLLRLLQEREFERVGGTRTVRSNARLIAATNRDLGEMVRARAFREDLYYRLNVFPIVVPPLRDRREDIPVLARYFIGRHAARLGRDVPTISAEGLRTLQRYEWPGNIRELENVIERAMILAQGPTLEVPPLHDRTTPDAETLDGDDLATVNRAHILGVLEATGWVVAGPHGAAARLGVKRSTLNYRMKKLGILLARPRGRTLSP